jgi:hypothetical protein
VEALLHREPRSYDHAIEICTRMENYWKNITPLFSPTPTLPVLDKSPAESSTFQQQNDQVEITWSSF